jgi:hypothetical protein
MARTEHPIRMYGQVSASSHLAWAWVERQLNEAETYWVDVTGSGSRPHPRPVWGVWSEEQLHLSIGSPAIRRAANARVAATVHLDSGLDVVILEGVVSGPTADADVIAAYETKYDWDYDLDQYGPLTTVAPKTVLAWRAAGPAGRDGFRHTGRWTWSESPD